MLDGTKSYRKGAWPLHCSVLPHALVAQRSACPTQGSWFPWALPWVALCAAPLPLFGCGGHARELFILPHILRLPTLAYYLVVLLF